MRSEISLLALAVLFGITPGERVLAQDTCRPSSATIHGTVNRAGYQFEYESFEGDHCREYRIRNKPGRPMTPVRWRYESNVFIDTNLPACKKNENCPWSTKVQQSYVCNHNATEIGFGINKDEHIETPVAVVEARLVAGDTWGIWKQAVSSFSGTMVDLSGRPRHVYLAFEPTDVEADGSVIIRFTASQSSQNAGDAPLEIILESSRRRFFTESIPSGQTAQWYYAIQSSFYCPRPNGSTITVRQGGAVLASVNAPAICQN